jgi:hypothetical protein
VEGLRVILGVRPQLLSSVLPKLMRQPLAPHALCALRELAPVTGPLLHHHIKSLVAPLLLVANKPQGGEQAKAAGEAMSALAAAMPVRWPAARAAAALTTH